MSGLRESKKRAVRKALFETAIRLFEEKGYDGVSVSEIVAAAGVAKGTFFNHFPNKADILADWYADIVGRSLETPSGPDDGTLADRLVRVIADIGERAGASPGLWHAKNEQAVTAASIQAVERESDAALVSQVTQLFDRAVAASTLPRETDTAALADLVLAIATGTWREAVVTGQLAGTRDRLRRRIECLCAMAAGGLAKSGTTP